MTTTMISSVAAFCTDLLTTSKCKELPFHNLEHTKEVVQNVKYLCAAMDINEQDTEVLLIAAWFHDTGFSMTYKGHEDQSKFIATTFLKEQKANKSFINKVCNCIDATKMPQRPTNVLAKVLCDADLFHLGTTNFLYKNMLLRKEWELFSDIIMADDEWQMLNINFLEEHRFKTTYGKEILENGKQENLDKLKQLIRLQ
ncbi:HD domain-containing protein [Maribacter cobaltidurans]|nr:HD domain-containing protein [Maribacter cobaltidurans]